MAAAGVLQEADDADSRARTRSQAFVEYFILYTSTSIRFSQLCQGYHDHCVVTANDGGMKRLGGGRGAVVHLCYGLGRGTGGGYHIFSIFCSVFSGVVNCSCMAGT